MNYANISSTGANDNMGGASVRILYAPLSYFTANGIKKVTASPTTLAEKVTIALTHTFKPGKGFHVLRSIIDTNKLKADPVGERGGRGIKEEAEGKISGNTVEMAALMSMFKNDEFIVLIPLHDGKYIQLGSEDLPAEILPSHDTGTIESGVNSMMVKITNFTMARKFYTGAIQYFPEGQFSAKINVLGTAAGDAVTLNLFGNTIGTATYEAEDTWQSFIFKLYTSINEDPQSYALSASLQGQVVTVFASNFDSYDFSGQLISVVTGGDTVVTTEPADHTFMPI